MQQPVSVMIVDDEVMALNNLKNLIDWEDAGFRIVAAETKPRKALDSFRKYRPQIVLIDIMMPVMSGLDLSREIFALNLPVRILILTSYKDFQYAKEAVEIGISNYLVKHELNSETLIAELGKLRTEIQDSEVTAGILRQRYIRSLIEGIDLQQFESAGLENSYIDEGTGKLIFLFVKVDSSYPVLQNIGISLNRNQNNQWDFPALVENSHSIDVIRLKSDEAVFIEYLNNSDDAYNAEIKSLDSSRKLQNRFSDMYGRSLTIAGVIVENKIADIQNLYSLAASAFRYSVFPGCGNLLDINEIKTWPSGEHAGLSDILKELGEELRKYDNEGIRSILKDIFSMIGSRPWNPGELQKTCERLIQFLEDFRKENLLSSLEDVYSEENQSSALEHLFTLSDIRNWFVEAFVSASRTARLNELNRYSRKVRMILDILHQEFHRDIGIDEIAAGLGISSVYLRKLFKKETGLTVVNYLTKLRMEKAAELLSSGHYRVFEVSGMVGYNASQYFSKVFKKYTGKSPQEYASGV